MLHLSEKCGKAIREISMLAFRKPKSLKYYLVRAEVQKQMIKAEGSRSCESSVCQICRDDSFLKFGNKFTGNVTGKRTTFIIIWIVTAVMSCITFHVKVALNNMKSRQQPILGLGLITTRVGLEDTRVLHRKTEM